MGADDKNKECSRKWFWRNVKMVRRDVRRIRKEL